MYSITFYSVFRGSPVIFGLNTCFHRFGGFRIVGILAKKQGCRVNGIYFDRANMNAVVNRVEIHHVISIG